jgi:UDP-3-O-[3-hydroxymyristoyl] glucosamine N-acyltransferase
MSQGYTLSEISNILGGQVNRDDGTIISRIASLTNAKTGEIAFVNDAKYLKLVAQSAASAFVLRPADAEATDKPTIIVDNPYSYFAKISALLNPPVMPDVGVAQSAVISPSASIPSSCAIGHQVVIGERVVLGDHVTIKNGSVIESDALIGSHTTLEPNVTIKHKIQIGNHCHIFSGAVIGSEGFGYAEEDGKWLKIPQVGRVIIHDHVDIGANTVIDRGALDDTIVHEGVKLDNLIQIGHNCIIGAHTVIAGCVGIAGSAKIGQHCKIGGAAMVLGHLEVVDHVTISPGTMVTRSLTKANTYTALMPYQTHKEWLTTAANIRNIQKLSDKLKQLEREVNQLKVKSNP